MFAAQNGGVKRWSVLKIVPGHNTEAVLLYPGFLPLTTHWHSYKRGCTLICPGEDTCAVHSHLAARGLWYTAVGLNGSIWILELGGESSARLEQACKLFHGGMKVGQLLGLKRSGAKRPVYSEVIDYKPETRGVDLMMLASRVMALYKYPCPNPDETIETYEMRIAHLAACRLERVMTELGKVSPE